MTFRAAQVFEENLRGFGFQHMLGLLAWVTGLTEVGCSVLVIAGFVTPLAAAGLFGQAISKGTIRVSSPT